MKPIDRYSYQLGVIDCFNEMIAAGVKDVALSHPCASPEERDNLLEGVQNICQQYGTSYYSEDNLLTTDLFPKSMTENCYLYIFYQSDHRIKTYLSLKTRKAEMIKDNCYTSENRLQLAVDFGNLLGYEEGRISDMIQQNSNKESL